MFNRPSAETGKSSLARNPARTICLSFLLIIAVGTFLLILPFSSRSGEITPLVDALFTATSATCVTGLVVYDTWTYWSPLGQTVILALIQIGGLGLVTMGTFFHILAGRRLGLHSIDLAKESVNTDSFAGVRQMVRTVILGTLLVEGLGAFFLAFTFVPRYGFRDGAAMSVFTSVSAFCNAGFDLMGRDGVPYASLTSFAENWAVTLPVMLLIVLGGLGFVVWEDLLRWRRTRTVTLHTRVVLVMTGLMLGAGAFLFLLFEGKNPETMGALSPLGKLNAALFQSVTCRTAGFNTVDLTALTDQSKLVSIILMFIGAAPAGTGGGVKVTTLAVLVMTVACVMRGEEDTIIRRRKIDRQAVYRALTLFTMAILVVGLSAFVIHFSLDGEFPALDVIFEEVSAFATVGLSVGVSGAASVGSRLILILNMFLGRVGLLSLALAIAMRSGGRKEVLPTARIIIG
jgi:trk system potassium uptake protein TrkH